ncbi:hypothetical protein HMPREF2724_01920 [Corynebacterium sp. HMSC071F07]|uniref:DUF202 domain-containing protein n=1 Tax=Corynebacterium sp. HMSC071F07 TaxID=1715203 RepID=UPI0008A16A87|nr:DUF202 domain-containing protein [Corynebacterium sp. HMSC071F07]OFM03947.1 hypothetical protein HMPREF2724_01920 [Corynebacterium sp. HMSC071F07]
MYDPGLQPERTRLSWQRSLLAFVLVVLVVLRSELPWTIAELIAFVGGAGACAWLGWRVRRRNALYDAALHTGGALPGAAALAGLAVVVMLLAVLALVGLGGGNRV